MKQTSVESLFYTMAKTPMTDWYQVLEQAKEMHKQESLETYNEGYRDGESNQCFSNPTQFEDVSNFSNAENYYNETFKKTAHG